MKSGFLKKLALSNRRDKYSDGGQNSLIFGKNGGDVIKGNNGNDDIRGQGGNDKLFGGRGRDILRGGKGRNQLSGGRGKDSFAISDGFSTILDYQLGVDKLLIDFEKYSDFAVSARGSSSSLQYNDTTGKQWSFIFKNISLLCVNVLVKVTFFSVFNRRNAFKRIFLCTRCICSSLFFYYFRLFKWRVF